MDDRILSVLIALGLSIIAAVGVTVYQRRKYASLAPEREAQAQAFAQLVRDGLRTPDGRPTCFCGNPATEYMPVTGTSWMDKLPLLNRLFSLPPRYVIVDYLDGDVVLCPRHKGVAVRKLEEFHAGWRSDRARFNAEQEEKVAAVDGGELARALMQQHAYQLKVLRRDASTPLPQLGLGSRIHTQEEEEIATAVVSGAGASIPPEEE